MRNVKLNKNINYLGELSDRSLENEFIQKHIKKTVNNIKIIVLSLAILNTLFLIPDYYVVKNINSFALICSARISFIFLVILLFIIINYINTYKIISYMITSYEVVCILLFIFIFYKYDSPNYLIQAFGVMVVILGVFMVPNRLINKIGVSLFVIVGFNIMSVYYISDINLMEVLAVVVYLIIILILSSINSFRDGYYKRVNYLYNKELIRLSTTDPLTGVYNRAKFNQESKRCIEYSKRYNSPLTIIIIDFDDFKNINDTFGHLIGDKVIIQFVNIVNNCIRIIDIFARWGGEEFVILLPNTEIEQGLLTAERLRKNIESYKFEVVNCITCSFGVAQLSNDDDADSLLLNADKMLYKSKSIGKNTVSGYPVN